MEEIGQVTKPGGRLVLVVPAFPGLLAERDENLGHLRRYTKAALKALPRDAEVIVAELFPIVVEWHRTHLQSLKVPLDDRRVRIHEGDVGGLLGFGNNNRFHAIALDTDNGPDATCLSSNASFYDEVGIERIKQSLEPKGVLAVWSAHEDPKFSRRLGVAGFDVITETVRGYQRKGARHTIFLARLGGGRRRGSQHNRRRSR